MTDFELITNPNKKAYLKVSLLNDAYQEVSQMQGELLELSMTISASSTIRRVASASFHIDDPIDLGKNYFGAWMDKMIQLRYGIWDAAKKEIKWFLLGSFLFTASGYTFDLANRQMSLSIADMMAAATEERGSQIGTDMEYPAGSNVKDALAATVARFSPYKRYDIADFEDVIPYDITIAKGSYPHDALKKIVSLYPWYEQYYSKDGVYTVKKIATTLEEPVILSSQQMREIIIKESGEVRYSDLKNATEIWGKEIDANYTAVDCVSQGAVYVLTIHSTYEKYEDGTFISFIPDKTNSANPKIQVKNLEAVNIYSEAGDGTLTPLGTKQMQSGRSYVVKYTDNKFILQGEAQIHVMCMEYTSAPDDIEMDYLKSFHNCEDIQIVLNPDSCFACDVIGTAKQVMSDGEYSNIYTTQLAHERASYENWKATRLQDALTIETLFVPWLDVNQKITYASIATGIEGQYIIQEIRVSPIRGTMTITLVRFYPLYPWTDGVVDDSNWLVVEDDNVGNVIMYSKIENALSAMDDGANNVTIKFALPVSIEHDDSNVTIVALENKEGGVRQ